MLSSDFYVSVLRLIVIAFLLAIPVSVEPREQHNLLLSLEQTFGNFAHDYVGLFKVLGLQTRCIPQSLWKVFCNV